MCRHRTSLEILLLDEWNESKKKKGSLEEFPSEEPFVSSFVCFFHLLSRARWTCSLLLRIRIQHQTFHFPTRFVSKHASRRKTKSFLISNDGPTFSNLVMVGCNSSKTRTKEPFLSFLGFQRNLLFFVRRIKTSREEQARCIPIRCW